MSLIDLIKKNLRERDKKIIFFLDLKKKDDELILDLVKAGFLKFENIENEDKEIK